jgi:hypothetical protein
MLSGTLLAYRENAQIPGNPICSKIIEAQALFHPRGVRPVL